MDVLEKEILKNCISTLLKYYPNTYIGNSFDDASINYEDRKSFDNVIKILEGIK